MKVMPVSREGVCASLSFHLCTDKVQRVWVVPRHQRVCGPDGFYSLSREGEAGVRWEKAKIRKGRRRGAFNEVQTRGGRLSGQAPRLLGILDRLRYLGNAARFRLNGR